MEEAQGTEETVEQVTQPATPKAKKAKGKKKAKGAPKRSAKRAPKRSAKKKPAPKKATRKPSRKATTKGVRTRTRSGKAITRAKAGGKGVMAKKGLHLIVVRVPAELHKRLWSKVQKMKAKDRRASMTGLALQALSRAA